MQSALNHLLYNTNFKLQAPTSSGKTMMVGLIIEKLLRNPSFALKKKTFIFVAPSTGSLDGQGYNKITSYLQRGWLKGFETHHISTSGGKSKKSRYLQNIDKFEENTIYFIGWSLFGKNSNLSKIDSEKNNIHRVIQNTKNNNIEIILIIDEAHREVMTKSDNKEVILKFMDPYRTMEISATLDNPNYKVTLQDVRDEKAIKKNVVIEMGIPEADEIDKPGEIYDLIYAALKKQKEIKKRYNTRKIDDNPLILIQIPDKSNNKIKSLNTKIDDYYLKQVQIALNENGLKEGTNYAIWLSENKTTSDKDKLIDIHSPYEVLVFKQAIATGWDIPRANILIRLREPVTPRFDIQTLGRILRNPRFKYYDSHLIDNAFVFTRDEKYYEKIKKEEFVEHSDKSSIPLSKFGKKSDMSINSLYYSKPVIEEDIVDYVYNKLIQKEKEIMKHVDKIEQEYWRPIKPIEVDAGKIQEGKGLEEIVSKTRRNKNASELAIDFKQLEEIDDDLFNVYIKYVSSFENKNFNFQAMDKFINHISQKGLMKKKAFYKKLIAPNAKIKISKEFKDKNIFEFLEYFKNKAMKNFSKIATQEYTLYSEFEYKEDNIISNQWDKINTYDLSMKAGWDSTIEKNFYKNIKDKLDLVQTICQFSNVTKSVHIFRNGTNDKSYFIEYYDGNDKLSKFYPDFILIDDVSQKVSILETKGRSAINQNIDQKSKFKFGESWSNMNLLKDKYGVEVFKVEQAPIDGEFNLINKNGESQSLTNFLSKKSQIIINSIKK